MALACQVDKTIYVCFSQSALIVNPAQKSTGGRRRRKKKSVLLPIVITVFFIGFNWLLFLSASLLLFRFLPICTFSPPSECVYVVRFIFHVCAHIHDAKGEREREREGSKERRK